MIQFITDLLPEAQGFVQFALWCGILLVLGTTATLGYLVWLRLIWIREKQILRQIEDDWLPLFKTMQRGIPFSTPHLSQRQKPLFVALWLETREFATGRFAADLDALAVALKLDLVVLNLLAKQHIRYLTLPAQLRAVAIRSSRWIDTPAIRAALYGIAEGNDYGFAIKACESLLQLGDKDSTRLVIQLLFRYPEHDKHITTRLGHAGGARVLRVLDPFLEKLSSARLEGFIHLIEQSGEKSLLSILVRRLKSPRTDDEIASLLRAVSKIGGPEQRLLVLPHLISKISFVRLQAASALGTVGAKADAELLLPLLSDHDWWVRYRAAQSYLKLSLSDSIEIDRLIAAQSDPYARDILIHAAAEKTWHLT